MTAASEASAKSDRLGRRRVSLPTAASEFGERALSGCDRALHPVRHFLVRLRLSRRKRPLRILVLCHGNVCRSPYLQRRLRILLRDMDVTSAGFATQTRSVPALAVAIGRERGVELSEHRSELISLAKLWDAELVIVMDPAQQRRLLRSFPISPSKVIVAPDLISSFRGKRCITDPWKGSADAFNAAFDQLDDCAATLANLFDEDRQTKLLDVVR
jgi:protein-tyrosine phosphatase